MRSRRGRADVAHPSHRHVDRRPAVETSPRRRRSSLPLTTPRQCNEERRRNTPRVVPSLFFVLAPERNGSETSRDGSRGALRRATTAAPPRGTSLFPQRFASLRASACRLSAAPSSAPRGHPPHARIGCGLVVGCCQTGFSLQLGPSASASVPAFTRAVGGKAREISSTNHNAGMLLVHEQQPVRIVSHMEASSTHHHKESGQRSALSGYGSLPLVVV